MSINASKNSNSYEIQAYAKINLMLEIISDREDGYHEIKSILQTVNLADHVRIIHDGLGRVEVSGPYKFGVPTDIAKIAALIGSDEAFFLNGGTALVSGRGELVEQLPSLPKHDVVLFVPELHVNKKTQRMFELFKGQTFDSGQRSLEFASSVPRNIDIQEVFNSFEQVAFTFFEGLKDLKVNIEKRIKAPVHLTGAGPTLFWIGMDINSLQSNFQDHNLPCQIIQTSTFSEPVL